jgi:hypothetical protein
MEQIRERFEAKTRQAVAEQRLRLWRIVAGLLVVFGLVFVPLRVTGDPPQPTPSLAERVAALEAKVAALETALGSEAATVAALQTALNNEVAARQAADTSLQNAIDTLNGQVSPVLDKFTPTTNGLFLNGFLFVTGGVTADGLNVGNGNILAGSLTAGGTIVAIGDIHSCGTVADAIGIVHGDASIQIASDCN